MPKIDPANGLPKRWKEFAAVIFIVWLALILLAFHLVRNEASGKWGQLGDVFGVLNTLVSVLGFAAVVYSLQRQHEDSKAADEKQKQLSREAEERHDETLKKQQELFEQNAKIALFEKRIAVFEAIISFIDTFNVYNTNINNKSLLTLMDATQHREFLFPTDSDVVPMLKQIQILGTKIRDTQIDPHIGIITETYAPQINENGRNLNQFFTRMDKTLTYRLFEKYLRVSEFTGSEPSNKSKLP